MMTSDERRASGGMTEKDQEVIQLLTDCLMDVHNDCKDRLQALSATGEKHQTRLARHLLAYHYWAQNDWTHFLTIATTHDAWLKIDIPLALFFSQQPPHAIQINDKLSTLPLQPSPTGVPMIPVWVNGTPITLWVDTGAGLSVFPLSIAKKLGMRIGTSFPTRIHTATGDADVWPGMASEIRLGGLVAQHVPVLILPDHQLTWCGMGTQKNTVHIDGLIGWNLIRLLDWEFRMKEGYCTVQAAAPSDGSAMKNLCWFNLPFVRALDKKGRPWVFVLDTGAGHSQLVSHVEGRLGGASWTPIIQWIQGAGGRQRVRGKCFENLTWHFNEHCLHFSSISALATFQHPWIVPDGCLGADILSAGSVSLAPLRGRLEICEDGFTVNSTGLKVK